MSSPNNNMQTLNGFFKELYADKVKNLIPEGLKVHNRVKFLQGDKLGNFYHFPVILGAEHGFTHAGQQDGAFNLIESVAGQVKDATAQGYQTVLRSSLSYSALSRATSAGKAAFENATKFVVGNMVNSYGKRQEVLSMYGQSGLGTIASTAGNVITVTTADWAAGIWSGMKSMPMEIRSSAGTLRGICNIQNIDMNGRTLTVDALPPGSVATDVLWYRTQYGNATPGIHDIISNTGTLFGIDASQYELWSGNSYGAGSAALSFAKIQAAIARAVEKGLDSKVEVLVNPRTWANLLTEQAALRMYDSSYSRSKSENGSESICFYGQNGEVEIIPSIYVKEGNAYVAPLDEYFYVGSTPMTFQLPGLQDQFIRQLENSAGFELRLFSDQILACRSPGHSTIITGISNS